MSSRKFGLNLVVVLAIAALFTGFWALVNRPVTAPNWPEQISGFSYSPFQQGQYPQKHMKGQQGTELCLYNKKSKTAYITEWDSIRPTAKAQ